jgi:hypothetical protein
MKQGLTQHDYTTKKGDIKHDLLSSRRKAMSKLILRNPQHSNNKFKSSLPDK